MSVHRLRGFSLIELMATIAVIGILALASVKFYQHYQAKASATELLELYDALREKTVIAADEKGMDLCGDPPVSLVDTANLFSPYAKLSIEKVDLGYANPIGLHMKADIPTEGKHNTDVLRGAYDTFNKLNIVAPGAVDNDSVVSFTALLLESPCSGSSVATTDSPKPLTPLPTTAKPQPPTVAEAIQQVPPEERAAVAQALDLIDSSPESLEKLAEALAPGGHGVGIPTPEYEKAMQDCGSEMSDYVAVLPDQDTFLGNCSVDFEGMCNECFVKAFCPVYCGIAKTPSPEVRAAMESKYRASLDDACRTIGKTTFYDYCQMLTNWDKEHP